jgi:hypothetical protein
VSFLGDPLFVRKKKDELGFTFRGTEVISCENVPDLSRRRSKVLEK